ncbi:F-box protein CPR1-like [Papaver somniferum]|uniref:F-box protein CPR1-like n=1 Tax=Papaver somniferum TaxID=3469 RepID=UPI000E6F61F6|nr:F-box protein CPR1-like [Papaver somniferum]
MSSLPEEIYLDILLRVPGKSAFACKFLCKSWYSIISNPEFVKQHLSFATQTNNYSPMLQNYAPFSDHSFRSISHDSLSSDDAVVKVMDFPSKTYEHRLLGSCDGLVYGFKEGIFSVWNPATNEFKRLPRLDTFYCGIGCHGFGYDYKNDDYKLVSIRQYTGFLIAVYIYSLKSNSWKSFKSKYGLLDQWTGVLFNGAVHWILETWKTPPNRITILSMDISEEKLKELQLPIEIQKIGDYCVNVGVVDECLCVLVRIGETFDFELWAMQDY